MGLFTQEKLEITIWLAALTAAVMCVVTMKDICWKAIEQKKYAKTFRHVGNWKDHNRILEQRIGVRCHVIEL